jgi:hypothetical protein
MAIRTGSECIGSPRAGRGYAGCSKIHPRNELRSTSGEGPLAHPRPANLCSRQASAA